jgi:hypothetical protein
VGVQYAPLAFRATLGADGSARLEVVV